MSGITTHVLDLALGSPARGIHVTLERESAGAWSPLGRSATDDDGRVKAWSDGALTIAAGRYRLTFETGAYFAQRGVATFYARVPVEFEIKDPGAHHHVPLLLSPFGYSTYRGS